MASHAALVVAPAVAAVAAGRVKFALYLVQGDEVAAMLEFPVRTVAIASGRFHFDLVGMAVITERAFVTGGTKPVIRRGIEAVVLDEGWCMAESAEGLHGSLLLVFVTFGAIYLLSGRQRFGMRSREAGHRFHPGAGGGHADKSGQCQEREQQFTGFHFFPPMPL